MLIDYLRLITVMRWIRCKYADITVSIQDVWERNTNLPVRTLSKHHFPIYSRLSAQFGVVCFMSERRQLGSEKSRLYQNRYTTIFALSDYWWREKWCYTVIYMVTVGNRMFSFTVVKTEGINLRGYMKGFSLQCLVKTVPTRLVISQGFILCDLLFYEP